MEAGTPDILISTNYGGDPINVMFEVKLPGEEPDPIQVYRLQEWGKAGMITAWVTSLEGVQRVFSYIAEWGITYGYLGGW